MTGEGGLLAHEFERKIRDPIYGYIPVTALENKIIDTRSFQRLDRLMQMPTARLVYPGAAHTRKSHSVGTMHLAHRAICTILYRQHPDLRRAVPPLLYKEASLRPMPGLDDLTSLCPLGPEGDLHDVEQLVQRVRLAGLLHDIGHGPFCHQFQHACNGFDHQRMSARIVQEVLPSEAPRLDKDTADYVAAILTADDATAPRFLYELISGPWGGCDKGDYLVRDAYYAGTPEYGQVDVDRIIEGLVVKNGVLAVCETELEAMLERLYSVFCMYSAVYFHKTCRVFDQMLMDALTSIPAVVKRVACSPEDLLQCDDFSFAADVLAAGRRSDASSGEKLAATRMRQLQERQKFYKVVVRRRLDFDLRYVDRAGGFPKLSSSLDQLAEAVEKKGTELGLTLVVDVRRISTSGIQPDKIRDWLRKSHIFRPSEGRLITLKESAVSEREFFLRVNIPISVLAVRDQIKDNEEAVANDVGTFLESQINTLYGKMHRREE